MPGSVVPLLLGLLHSPQAATPPMAEPPKTVLFVCEHGAAKSVIAAAYFDRLARESLVTRADVDQAARVIVFAAPVPGDVAEPKMSDWNDVPAVSDGYDAATRAIRARVERLVEQLAGKK